MKLFVDKMFSVKNLLILSAIILLTCIILAKSFLITNATYSPDSVNHPPIEEYQRMRRELLGIEKSQEMGSQVKLNEKEKQINQTIMAAKLRELDEGFSTPHLFKPSQKFLDVVQNISKTILFKYLQRMPKGGVLHAHDTALGSTDYLLNLTEWDHLWACQVENNKNDIRIKKLMFSIKSLSNDDDDDDDDENCSWKLLSVMRNIFGKNHIDEYLRERFKLNREQKFSDGNDVWNYFTNVFTIVTDLLTYEPAWKAYFQNALKEYYEDGVQYLEFRTTLPQLYDLNGKYFPEIHTAEVYYEALQEFMNENPKFIGSKLIYAPRRWVNSSVVEKYIEIANRLKREFPTFFAGFDLVGQEDKGHSLSEFLPQLLTMPTDINFYFHAGETNWFGTSTDENLVDAVLLGTKRIGHGYALVKHPEVLNRVKSKGIAIEICPISNQILQLVEDFRNHPSAYLFARDYPVIVSSDDPSFWEATPLSHDFYIAFLGITSANSDLRFLKKLAMNSIEYSAMSQEEKRIAFTKWQQKWDKFIEFNQQSLDSIDEFNEI